MFKFISFGLFGTLIEMNPKYENQRNQDIARYLIENKVLYDFHMEYESLVEKVGKVFQTIEKDVCYINKQNIFIDKSTILTKFIKSFQCNRDFEFEEFFNIIKKAFELYPPILKNDIKYLKYLSEYEIDGKCIELGIIFNSDPFIDDEVIFDFLKIYGIYKRMDIIRTSTILQKVLPDPNFYAELYKEANCSLDEMIHVGSDMILDKVGPKEFGFRTYQINDLYNESLKTFCEKYYKKKK